MRFASSKLFASILEIFGYIFPPPKIALFGERTLKEATASSAGEGEFSRQSLARLILSRREKRENTSSSKLLRMLGFSLKRRRKVLRADVFAI